MPEAHTDNQANKMVSHALKSFKYDSGRFYGSPVGLSLGVGLIYSGINFPLLDEETKLFDTAEGMVYVLTHECDSANERAFNDYILICPIHSLPEWIESYLEERSEESLRSFLTELGADNVHRALLVPPISRDALPHGGIIYLNQICNTHKKFFEQPPSRTVCALSQYAQDILDKKIENHLLREKSDRLPMLRGFSGSRSFIN